MGTRTDWNTFERSVVHSAGSCHRLDMIHVGDKVRDIDDEDAPSGWTSCPGSPVRDRGKRFDADVERRFRSSSTTAIEYQDIVPASAKISSRERCACGRKWSLDPMIAEKPNHHRHHSDSAPSDCARMLSNSMSLDIEDITSRTEAETRVLAAELVDAKPRLVIHASPGGSNASMKGKCSKCGKPDCSAVVPKVGFYTVEQIAQHSTPDDCWISANGFVYDVTRYVAKHPGGPNSILKRAGEDASADYEYHTKRAKERLWKRYKIGRVARCDMEGPEKCCIQ